MRGKLERCSPFLKRRQLKEQQKKNVRCATLLKNTWLNLNLLFFLRQTCCSLNYSTEVKSRKYNVSN